jgi:DNA repair protein RadD
MYSLRYYQENAVNSIFHYFKEKSGNPLLVMPTGTGKSIVIAEFLRRVFSAWPNQRILKLTHVKELIQQNYDKLKNHWPDAPVGIYSAGLKRRDIFLPIIFGGVQSVAKEIEREVFKSTGISNHFGKFDLIIIDEAHLLSPKEDTSYQFVISELKKINPNLKVIGLTATPFRIGQGLLTDSGLFTDVCFDLGSFENFNKLVIENYISPLISKKTKTDLDISKLKISCGEYTSSSLDALTTSDEVVLKIVEEIIQCSQDRISWMIFCSGIEAVEKTNSVFLHFGVNSTFVHSKLSNEENTKRIQDFKLGKFQCIVNNNKLTTGFDHPAVDLIALITATTSAGKFVQMLGRGTRPCVESGKANCLVLDFGSNIKRLGPINDPVLPRKPDEKKGPSGDPPIKICPQCSFYCHCAVMVCELCGYKFERENKLTSDASSQDVMKMQNDIIKKLNVKNVLYEHYQPKNLESKKCLRVVYQCKEQTVKEYVSLDNANFGIVKKARQWWKDRANGFCPPDTETGMQFTARLPVPKLISVNFSKPMPEIVQLEY